MFDVLALAGLDLRDRPYWVRREHLEQLLRHARPPLALTPTTRELVGAQAWMTEHTAAGIEGVVVKDVRHGYRPGRRAWTKVRTRTTAEAVVGGVLGPIDAPEALLLGRPDADGRLRIAGRTSPLPHAVRRELGALLKPPSRRHPWPYQIPSSRVITSRPGPIPACRLHPDTAAAGR